MDFDDMDEMLVEFDDSETYCTECSHTSTSHTNSINVPFNDTYCVRCTMYCTNPRFVPFNMLI